MPRSFGVDFEKSSIQVQILFSMSIAHASLQESFNPASPRVGFDVADKARTCSIVWAAAYLTLTLANIKKKATAQLIMQKIFYDFSL